MGDRDALPVGDVPERPYSVRDEEDHFSLIHFLSDKLKAIVMDLPEELLVMTEAELKHEASPTTTDYALRVSFWREFERVMWKGSGKIVSAQIYTGVCTDVYFYKKFLHKPAKFAWMIRPMQSYQKAMEAILHRCTEQLWELANIPLKDSKGRWIPKHGALFLQAHARIENRIHGMAIQRTEARNMNVNVVTRGKATHGIESMGSIDDRIKQLEAEVASEEEENRGEAGAGNDQALSVEVTKEEREVVRVGVFRGEDPARGE